MAWLRLTITSYSEYIEPLSELLENFGALALSFVPETDEQIFADGPGAPALWKKTSVIALLDRDTDLDILLACIRNRVGTDHIIHYHIESLADREWSECHKSGHGAMAFGGKLCICPSWDNAPEDVTCLIRLDPGLAFGTGSHPTTALCLEWLVAADLQDKRVIDYGCGSGILALAAASLGAACSCAVDIDPQALMATRRNAENNRLATRIRTSTPDQIGCEPADILVANILLNPLLGLVDVFASLVRPGGKLLLSGILAVQVEECLAAYNRWFMMNEPVFREEWALLDGERRNND